MAYKLDFRPQNMVHTSLCMNVVSTPPPRGGGGSLSDIWNQSSLRFIMLPPQKNMETLKWKNLIQNFF